MADPSTRAGKTATESLTVPSHGGSPPTSRPATLSTSKKTIQKVGSWLRKPFPKSTRREAESTAANADIAQDQNPQATTTTVPETLLVRTESIYFEEDTVRRTRKIAGYDLAIAVIDIFQPRTDLALQTPVVKVLEQLTSVLGVLKQMVENKESWKELLLTLVDHRDQFNEQLALMKQDTTTPDADSPVLAPLKGYSTALERLTAKIILESGLVQQNPTEDAGWDKIKRFTTKYIGAESEKLKIGTYRQDLRDAMQMLSQRLGLYVAFTVGHINEKLDSNATARPIPRKRVVAKRPPEVSPYYVARDKEWNYLVHHLVDSTTAGRKIVCITGMGGCGKTQLVSYFLKHKKNLFTYLVYVDASSTASIKADLGAWAQSLGDGHEEDDWENALCLLGDGRWVYILDNADDPDLVLRPFIPESSDGTIIITSRNRGVANLTMYHLEMGEMTEEEALSALMKAARRESPLPAEERQSVDTLMKELGWLALALVHAGTYCHELSSGGGELFTFTMYLKDFRTHRATLMKWAGPATIDSYELGVYTTLDLSYQKLPQSARELFRLISNFHYSDIPMEMLATAAEAHFEDPRTLLERPKEHENSVSRLTTLLRTSHSESEFRVKSLIPTLRSFSLVSTTFVDRSLFLQIHPLVQAWARDMESPDAVDYGIMAIQILTSCSIDSNISAYRHLLPHIIEKLEGNQGTGLHVNDQMAFAQVLLKMGRYVAAEVLFQDILKLLQNLSMEETENSLWVAGFLAETYSAQGWYDEAEKLELEVLKKRKKILGTEHPDTVLAAANLASTYYHLGRYQEAETLELEVLEKRKKILGTEHPDTIVTAGNLARIYSAQGRYDEAEKLELEVLEKHKKILGTEHPATILAAANLAATYHNQGRWDETETLELGVLEKGKKILGAEHPDAIRAAANLAATYSAQGRYDEAEKLELEVLEKRKKILGTEHPATILAAANLAGIYSVQGRYDEAKKLELEVLEKRKKILGPEHPDTIVAAGNLALTYSAQGQYDKAEKLELEVLEKRKKILGAEHPNTILAAANLAVTYSFQGRYDVAEMLGLEVLEKRKKILGTEHPDTIVTAGNLARIYSAQGRYDKAEKLELEVLEKRKKILGAEHPDAIRAAANLAGTYSAQGRYDEAEMLGLEVLEKRKKILGTEHPATILAAANLACTYSAQGRYGDAEVLDLEVLEKRRRILGANHPHTALAAANLAGTYRSQGRLEEAERLEAHSAQKEAPESASES